MEYWSVALGVVAGLVLFLYGVSRLAQGLAAVAGDRAKGILARFTTNRFAGLVTGTAATTVLDSSSVTIIMVIALVDAGLLTFVQSLGVILGANIGTTVSSQIIAFDVNQYAPVAMATGFGLHLFGKTEGVKNAGLALLGVGLIFFGLDEMGGAVAPLREHPGFKNAMTRMESPLLGALVGAGVTVLIQSSSATLGIVITLASQGMVSLPAGVAIMLGAEVGTCADTLLATIGRSREALRAGLFHLLFNVGTAAVGIAFAGQIAELARSVSGGAGVARQIANAHVIFNVTGALLVVGGLPWIARALGRVVPAADVQTSDPPPLHAAPDGRPPRSTQPPSRRPPPRVTT
jgi:phosphate:Na+ symporter